MTNKPVKKVQFDIPVMGMKHRLSVSTRRMLKDRVDEETVEAMLQPEPENPHDKNAVKVLVVNEPFAGFHLGYVPREVAAKLHPTLLSIDVEVVACVITEMDAEEGTANLYVSLKTPARPKKKKSK